MLVAVTVPLLQAPSIRAAYKKWEHVQEKLRTYAGAYSMISSMQKKVKSAILSHPRNIFNVFPIHSPIVYLAETPRRSIIEMTWSTNADTYSMISSIEN
jgi:hypothetical protein